LFRLPKGVSTKAFRVGEETYSHTCDRQGKSLKPKRGEIEMKIQVCDRHFGIQKFELSLLEWIKLNLEVDRKVYAFHARKEGWSGELPFYIVKCSDCKQYFLDYPHGFSDYFLCPLCDLPKLQVSADEVVDQDMEQMKDESNKDWVQAWRKKVNRHQT
jgi:hypothetical protein